MIAWTLLLLAQMLTANLSKNNLVWSWKGTPQAGVSEFDIKCGPTPRNYTKVTTVTDPTARQVSVLSAVGGEGIWYCAVFAANKTGASAYSDEINFRAGWLPAGPTNLSIE